MSPIQTFDQSLSALMKKHRLTISDLTRRLNIKSNTTLSRVLHAQCSPQAAEHFFEQLTALTPPVFDTQELKVLGQALEVSRLGISAYTANLEMWRLLSGETIPSLPFPVESYGGANFTNTTQLRAFYRTVRSATVHIAASLVYPLFSEIRDMLLDLVPSENIHVHHYFPLEGDDTQIIRSIRTALPVLCLPGYRGYKMTRPVTLDKEFLAQNHAVIRFQRADGSYGTHLIAFVANRCLLYENAERNGLFDMLVRRIIDQGRWYAPIKEEQDNADLQDVLVTSKRIYLQEKDRTLYGIKPDIPLSAIPFDLIESLVQSSAGQTAMSDAMLSELRWIHMQRNRNLFEKKAPTHFILQRNGLRRFAETGMISNLPAGLRVCTPTERAVILSECLRRTQEIPSFRIHLAKGRLAALDSLEVMCVDRLGVQFFSLCSGGPMGAMLTVAEFTRLFQHFYTEELLGKCVETDDVCHGYIQGLIDGLKQR